MSNIKFIISGIKNPPDIWDVCNSFYTITYDKI